MLFTSLNFLVFFCLTTLLYYSFPHRFRWMLLLSASLVFYLFSFPAYAIVLSGSIIMNYFFGIRIDRCQQINKRKRLLVVGIVMNLLLLAIFRYADAAWLFVSGHSLLYRPEDPAMNLIIIPLGISFYTFTNIGYLIEVKKRNVPAEKHAGYFALYVSFFPKLIQGPIERPQHFLPQLREQKAFNYDRVISGIRLMLWGFFKKLVIADTLSVIVNPVYDDKLNWHGPLLLIATGLFAFQIWMDFSGYIDIARGAAKVLGFDLSRNFNSPYLSKSIKEFWTRWHITLSQWLRDYIFLPLAYFLSARMKKERYGGIATEKLLYSMAISVTFLICGLWHGTGWHFIAWGGLFAVYLMAGFLTEKPKKRFYRRTGIIRFKTATGIFQVIVTFLLVCFAWIFFRAADLGSSLQIVSRLLSDWGREPGLESLQTLQEIMHKQGISMPEAGLLLILIPCIEWVEYNFHGKGRGSKLLQLPLSLRWGAYYILVLLIFYFGRPEINTFIYFQF
jgi:alginate O-acetyltransferase complex protein AlgI